MAAQRVWVIGDIHGMFDPLNRLLRQIRLFEMAHGGGDVTLVFLGDYIDYGPSSRQVIDALIDLRREFRCVFLAGNHEDLLLQFLRKDELFRRFGNIWFRGNDGHVTVASLVDDPDLFERAFAIDAEKCIHPEDIRLRPEHLDFIETLKYAHTEEISAGEGTIKFAFCHALLHRGPSPADTALDIPAILPEDQLALETYEQFHQFRRERSIWIEDLHVWNRDLSEGRYGDFILIHGHTPTILMDQYHDDIGTYDPSCGLPYLHLALDGAEIHRAGPDCLEIHAGLNDVAAIDIDTGAVYGKCLTALLLDAAHLLNDGLMAALQVRMDCSHRHGLDQRLVEFKFLD